MSPAHQESIAQLEEFAARVEQAAVDSMKEDISYGDIPEEFRGQSTQCSLVLTAVSGTVSTAQTP